MCGRFALNEIPASLPNTIAFDRLRPNGVVNWISRPLPNPLILGGEGVRWVLGEIPPGFPFSREERWRGSVPFSRYLCTITETMEQCRHEIN